jgi:RNA polymerase sigma-70 factor (ECF subfamily)
VSQSPELETDIAAALAQADFTRAATLAIRGYGPAVLGYLRAVLASEADANEAFSVFSEDLWRGLPGFRGQASVCTWSYVLAYNAALRVARDPYRRRGERLGTDDAERLVQEVRSQTATHLKTDTKDKLRELRRALTPADQTLLVLKLDRHMSWREVALVLGESDEAVVRKRFERVKHKLRKLAVASGLLAE